MLIEVVEYQPGWPDQYESARARLAVSLADLIIAIDHIGSTAVPGLAAKPVIDVQISVASLEKLPAIKSALTEASFIYRPDASRDRAPPWDDSDPEQWVKAYFRTADGVSPRIHVHVREAERRNQRYALLFRDYLRANPRARDAYGDYKLKLSALTADTSGPGGTGDYLDMKDPVLDLIADAAEKWALETGWVVPKESR